MGIKRIICLWSAFCVFAGSAFAGDATIAVSNAVLKRKLRAERDELRSILSDFTQAANGRSIPLKDEIRELRSELMQRKEISRSQASALGRLALKLNSARIDIKSLNDEVDMLEGELKELFNSTQTIRDRENSLKKRLSYYEEKENSIKAVYQKKFEEYKENVREEKDVIVARSASALRKLDDKLSVAESQIKQLRDEAVLCDEQLKAARAEAEKIQTANDALKGQIEKYEGQQKRIRSEYESREESIKDNFEKRLQKEQENNRKQIAELKDRQAVVLADLSRQLETAHNDLARLQEEVKLREEQLRQAGKEAVGRKSSGMNAAEDIEASKLQMQKEKERFTTELQAQKARSSEEKLALIEKNTKTLEALQLKLTQAQEKIALLEQETWRCQKELKASQSELNSSKQRETALQKNLASAQQQQQKQKADYDARLQDLNQKNRTQIDDLSAQKNKELTELQQQLITVKEQMRQFQPSVLEEQLKAVKSEKDAANKSIEELKKRIETYQSNESKLKDEHAVKIKELKQRYEDQAAALRAQKEEEQEKFKSQLAENRRENNDLRSRISGLDKELDLAKSGSEEAGSRERELYARISSYAEKEQKIRTDYVSEIQLLEAKCKAQLSALASQKDEEINKLQQQLHLSKEQEGTLQKQSSGFQKELAQSENTADALRQEKKSLEEKITGLTARLGTYDEKEKKIKADYALKLDELEQRYNTKLESVMVKKGEEISRLQSELAAADKDHARRVSEYEKKESELKLSFSRKIESMEIEHKVQLDQLAVKKAEYSAELEAKLSAQKEAAGLQEQKLQTQFKDKEVRIQQEYELKINELKNRMTAQQEAADAKSLKIKNELESRLNTISADREAINKKLIACTVQLEASAQQVKRLTDKENELKTELQLMENDNKSIAQQLSDGRAETVRDQKQMKESLSLCEAELGKSQKQLNDLIRRDDSLTRKISDLETREKQIIDEHSGREKKLRLEYEEKMKTLEAELKQECSNIVSRHTGVIAQLEEKLSVSEAKAKETAGELLDNINKLKQAQAQVQELKSKEEKLTKLVDDLKVKIKEQDKSIQDKLAKIKESHEKDNTGMMEQFEAAKIAYKQKCIDYETEVSLLRSDKEQTLHDRDRIASELNKVLAELSQAAQGLEKEQERSDELSRELKHQQEIVAVVQSQLKKCTGENEELNQLMNREDKKSTYWKQQMGAVEEKLAKVSAEAKEYKSALEAQERLTGEQDKIRQNMQKDIDELKSSLSKIKQEKEELSAFFKEELQKRKEIIEESLSKN